MADYPTFTAPNRTNMTLDQARKQAGDELGSLYNRALQNIQSQLYTNKVASAEQSAARGLGHSGLAQDAMNKLTIAAQSQQGDMEADRASKVASLARQILERDQDVGFRDRQQAFNEWNGQQSLRMDVDKFNYQKQYDTDRFNYQKQHDSDQLAYQKSRDSITDGHWQQEFDLKKQAAASSSSGGGGGGGSRGRSSSGRSSGGSSSSGSSSSSKASTNSNVSGYTRDQIEWYSNPSNAPYAYGQKKETTASSFPAIQPKNDFQPITYTQKLAWNKL